jgi:hypothetical protein
MGFGSLMAGVALPFDYAPNLAPVGSGAAYWPGDVEEDVFALSAIGFFPDDVDLRPSQGSQAADMASESGAWATEFRAAVSKFQASAGLIVDSWIGPQTRRALAAAVAAANAGAPLPNVPPNVTPVDPGRVPARRAVLPGVAPTEGMSTGAKVAIGAGVLVTLAGGYYLLK